MPWLCGELVDPEVPAAELGPRFQLRLASVSAVGRATPLGLAP